MGVGFNNLADHVIGMDYFSLKWRFIDPKYDQLCKEHLLQLLPLDVVASRFLWVYIKERNLHGNIPFQTGLFRPIDTKKIWEGNEQEVKQWLFQRGVPNNKQVLLSWTPSEAMIVPWELLIIYFDCFYYCGSDDLTVIDQSLNWALLFFHTDEIYFGSNDDFVNE